MSQRVRPRIAVVTDSAADIPPHILEEYEIHIEPLILIMGSETLRDGVDNDPPSFYELLRTSSCFPTTSQPTVASFVDRFSKVSQGK